MLKLIFNKDDTVDTFFFENRKLAVSWGAPQEYEAKFRFAIHPKESSNSMTTAK